MQDFDLLAGDESQHRRARTAQAQEQAFRIGTLDRADPRGHGLQRQVVQ